MASAPAPRSTRRRHDYGGRSWHRIVWAANFLVFDGREDPALSAVSLPELDLISSSSISGLARYAEGTGPTRPMS
jgi:hypothetical protein